MRARTGIKVFLLLCGFVALPLEARAQDEPLSLEACWKLAQEKSLKLKIAQGKIQQGQANKLEAVGSVVPRLSLESRFSVRNNDPGIVREEGPFVTGGRQLGTARMSLQVPIYDFGNAQNQIKVNNLSIHIAELQAEQVAKNLRLEVTQAYFRILEAEKIKTVVEESIQAVEQQLKVSEDYYRQGLVAKNDLLVAEVQLARRKQELIQAQNNIDLATATLNQLIGAELDAPTHIEEVLAAQSWDGSFEELADIARNKRPDLQIQALSTQISQALYRAARSNFLPKIYGFAGANATSDSRTLNQTWFDTGVGLNWAPFDLGNVARLKQQKLKQLEARQLEQDAVDGAMLELRRAYLRVREATQKIPVAQKSIDQATENLRITRDRYGEGLITSADVLLEEERLAVARSDYYRALYEYHQAFAELTYTLGGEVPPSPESK